MALKGDGRGQFKATAMGKITMDLNDEQWGGHVLTMMATDDEGHGIMIVCLER